MSESVLNVNAGGVLSVMQFPPQYLQKKDPLFFSKRNGCRTPRRETLVNGNLIPAHWVKLRDLMWILERKQHLTGYRNLCGFLVHNGNLSSSSSSSSSSSPSSSSSSSSSSEMKQLIDKSTANNNQRFVRPVMQNIRCLTLQGQLFIICLSCV